MVDKKKQKNSTSSKQKRAESTSEIKGSKTSTCVSSFIGFSKYLLIILLSVNTILPIVIYVWPNVMSHLIFMTFIPNFTFKDLSKPELYGLDNTRHFKLEHDNVSLGVWHILPNNQPLAPFHSVNEHLTSTLGNKENQTVILYLHGNTMDRGAAHRVELYKIFQNLDYHTIAIDYRGYGDSTGVPNENDVVKDAMYIFDHIHEISKSCSIYVWGHSLGTGIATKLNRLLNEKNKFADGLVLESPFSNIVEEVELYPLGKIWMLNPIMISSMKTALDIVDLQFSSDVHITKIKSKILILHAEDDLIIPFSQAVKLYEAAKSSGVSKSVEYVIFKSDLGLGHRHIYTAPNIIEIIRNFVVPSMQ